MLGAQAAASESIPYNLFASQFSDRERAMAEYEMHLDRVRHAQERSRYSPTPDMAAASAG